MVWSLFSCAFNTTSQRLQAIIGLNIFGDVKLNPGQSGLSEYANFRDFPTTMLLLFR